MGEDIAEELLEEMTLTCILKGEKHPWFSFTTAYTVEDKI